MGVKVGTVSLKLGIRSEVLSSILGILEIFLTQHYYNYVQSGPVFGP
jgi:hypothetical protein